MAVEQFVEINFSPATQVIIDRANAIIEDYARQGFKLTLRQLFYQFVQQNWIKNKQSEYKRLGTIIDKARKAGEIDWEAIEDRTRNLAYLPTWDRPGDFMSDAYKWYREDLWATQLVYPEVWIEKDALTGVIDGVCREYQVPYFACRGNVSQSEMYAAAQRFKEINESGRRVIVFHLGDHDPSGLDMSRDNASRLEMLSRNADIELIRLGLNMDQILRYNPPPNPAKETDSRFGAYRKLYGRQVTVGGVTKIIAESWELDSMRPAVIVALIRTAIESLIDRGPWDQAIADQERRRAIIETVSDHWFDAVMTAHREAYKDAPDPDDV